MHSTAAFSRQLRYWSTQSRLWCRSSGWRNAHKLWSFPQNSVKNTSHKICCHKNEGASDQKYEFTIEFIKTGYKNNRNNVLQMRPTHSTSLNNELRLLGSNGMHSVSCSHIESVRKSSCTHRENSHNAMAWLLCDNVTCMCLSSSSRHLVYHSVIWGARRRPLCAGSTTTCTRRHPCISATIICRGRQPAQTLPVTLNPASARSEALLAKHGA